MLLELYIFYSIIGFLCFFIALYFNKGINNIFVWPIGIVCFSMLIFTSYDININGLIHTEPALSILNIGLAILSAILFIWDLIDKFYTGELF